MDEISYQKLLTTRICDLDLNIDHSMESYFETLKEELNDRQIQLWPDFYFGNSWGCVNKTMSICIPFYFSNEELKAIEGSTLTGKNFLKVLRHETGHAVNYAHKLWKRKDWKDIFGNFNKKYPEKYLHLVNPWSKSYVKHLHDIGEDRHYAQRHPDEDWAETFAVWLDPKSRWHLKYKNWPVALQKLLYVNDAMKEIEGTKPLVTKKKHDGDYRTIEDTVSEWWGLGEEEDSKIQEYLEDMNDLFIQKGKRRKLMPAERLIKNHTKQLSEKVNNMVTGANKYAIRKCLRQWETICKKEGLYYHQKEAEDKLLELSSLLTYHALNDLGRVSPPNS